jgi:hypothetical protein
MKADELLISAKELPRQKPISACQCPAHFRSVPALGISCDGAWTRLGNLGRLFLRGERAFACRDVLPASLQSRTDCPRIGEHSGGRIHDLVLPITPPDKRAGSYHRLADRFRGAGRSDDLRLRDSEAVDPEFCSSRRPLTIVMADQRRRSDSEC